MPPGGAWRMALVRRLSRMRPTTVGSSQAQAFGRPHRQGDPARGGGGLVPRGLLGEESLQCHFDRPCCDALGHGEKLADQRVETVDLGQHLANGQAAARVVAGKGVLALEPRRRQGIADLMGDTGGDTAEASQPLRPRHPCAHRIGLQPRFGETRPGVVQGIDDAVELALARPRHGWHAGRPGAAERGLDAADMASPDQQRPAEPDRHQQHQPEQHPEPELQGPEAPGSLHPGHRPGGETGNGAGEQAGMKQQGLRRRAYLPVRRLLVLHGLPVHGLDLIPLRRRQIGLRTGAFIAGEGVGQRPGIGLPDAALDAPLMRQRQPHGRGEIALKRGVGQVREAGRSIPRHRSHNGHGSCRRRAPPRLPPARPGPPSSGGRAEATAIRPQCRRPGKEPKEREGELSASATRSAFMPVQGLAARRCVKEKTGRSRPAGSDVPKRDAACRRVPPSPGRR